MANPPAAPQQAGTQHPAGANGAGFPPFKPEAFASQLFWLVIAFALLYALMAKVALPRVGAVIENRRARIEKDIDDAASMRRQADEAGAAYDRTMAAARNSAQAHAQENQAKLAAAADQRRRAVENELNAKLAAAEAEISAIRAKSMASVGAIAAEAGGEIVWRLTGKPADPAAIARALAAPQAG